MEVLLCTCTSIQEILGLLLYLLNSVESENLDFFGEGKTCFRCAELGLKKAYKASLWFSLSSSKTNCHKLMSLKLYKNKTCYTYQQAFYPLQHTTACPMLSLIHQNIAFTNILISVFSSAYTHYSFKTAQHYPSIFYSKGFKYSEHKKCRARKGQLPFSIS